MEKSYSIRYIKTRESFQADCPDPLDPEGAPIRVELADSDMLLLIKGGEPEGIDDDSRLGIRALMRTHVLSPRALRLARTQAHLRKLGRADSSWLELKPKKRAPRKTTPENAERLAYLRENAEAIADRCVRHGWLGEYIALRKDLDPHARKEDIARDFTNARARIIIPLEEADDGEHNR